MSRTSAQHRQNNRKKNQYKSKPTKLEQEVFTKLKDSIPERKSHNELKRLIHLHGGDETKVERAIQNWWEDNELVHAEDDWSEVKSKPKKGKNPRKKSTDSKFESGHGGRGPSASGHNRAQRNRGRGGTRRGGRSSQHRSNTERGSNGVVKPSPAVPAFPVQSEGGTNEPSKSEPRRQPARSRVTRQQDPATNGWDTPHVSSSPNAIGTSSMLRASATPSQNSASWTAAPVSTVVGGVQNAWSRGTDSIRNANNKADTAHRQTGPSGHQRAPQAPKQKPLTLNEAVGEMKQSSPPQQQKTESRSARGKSSRRSNRGRGRSSRSRGGSAGRPPPGRSSAAHPWVHKQVPASSAGTVAEPIAQVATKPAEKQPQPKPQPQQPTPGSSSSTFRSKRTDTVAVPTEAVSDKDLIVTGVGLSVHDPPHTVIRTPPRSPLQAGLQQMSIGSNPAIASSPGSPDHINFGKWASKTKSSWQSSNRGLGMFGSFDLGGSGTGSSKPSSNAVNTVGIGSQGLPKQWTEQSEPGADGDVAAVAQDSGKAVSVSKLLSSMTGPMASTAGQLPPGFEMRSSEEIEREMFLEAQSKDAAEQQQQQQQQQVATDARAPSLIPSAPSSATADGAPTAIAVPVDASPVLVATSPVASGVFVPVSCPYPRQLQILHAMGFSDPATCAAVLVLHRGDIQASVNELLSYAP